MQIFAANPRSSVGLAEPYNIAEGGYLTTRGHPARIPAATGLDELWLPIQYNNIHEDIFSPDSTVQSTIRRFNLDTRRTLNAFDEKVILSAVHIHDNNTYRGPGWDLPVSGPVDIAFSTNGDTAYVLHELSANLVVMPTNTPAVKPAGGSLTVIDVGERPRGVVVSPTADIAFVSNLLSRDLSVIDLAAGTETARVPLTLTSAEPFSADVLTGARIFHSSRDPRISSNGKVACASCHINAEHDGRTWAFHNLPGDHGPRQVPTMLGLAQTTGPVDPTTGLGPAALQRRSR